MSERARKAGQFAGAVERLAVELAMVEIIQALGAAVHLRQQMEIAEFTRGLIEQQKAAQEPQGGPLPC